MACNSAGARGRRLGRTPLGATIRGLAAGAAGTVAMDVYWFVRYRRTGGEEGFADWEFSSGLCTWDEAPAPAQIGKRLVEGIFGRELPGQRAALVNNITHWAYGILGGIEYGIVAGSLRTPRIRYGLPFGAALWATSYAVLPAAGLYKHVWEYDRSTLARDLGAHIAYGLGTAAAFFLTDIPGGRKA
jgi:hypothetical protein